MPGPFDKKDCLTRADHWQDKGGERNLQVGHFGSFLVLPDGKTVPDVKSYFSSFYLVALCHSLPLPPCGWMAENTIHNTRQMTLTADDR